MNLMSRLTAEGPGAGPVGPARGARPPAERGVAQRRRRTGPRDPHPLRLGGASPAHPRLPGGASPPPRDADTRALPV